MDLELRTLERRVVGRRVSYDDWTAWVRLLVRIDDPRAYALDRMRRYSLQWYDREHRTNLRRSENNDNKRWRRLDALARTLLERASVKFLHAYREATRRHVLPDVEPRPRGALALIYCLERCRLIGSGGTHYGRGLGDYRLATCRWHSSSVGTVVCPHCDDTHVMKRPGSIPGFTGRICAFCAVEHGLLSAETQSFFNNID